MTAPAVVEAVASTVAAAGPDPHAGFSVNVVP